MSILVIIDDYQFEQFIKLTQVQLVNLVMINKPDDEFWKFLGKELAEIRKDIAQA